jgi:hypothetical protein
MEVLLPTWTSESLYERSWPAWPATFDGMTIGLLDNSKAHAGLVIDRLFRELSRGGRTRVVRVQKATPSGPLSQEDRQELAKSHFIVTGLGD